MVVPIVASICRELFLQVPSELEEGALALGATRWEMVRGVILPATRTGIAAAIILGLGRALGEAIAVTQVIGGGTQITAQHLRAERHAREQDRRELPGRRRRPSRRPRCFYLAAILLVIGLVTNFVAQFIVRRFDPLQGRALMSAATPQISLKPSGRLRRRRIVNRIMEALGTFGGAARRRPCSASWSRRSRSAPGRRSAGTSSPQPPNLFGGPGGGISSAIVGSAIIVGIATAIALPLGVLIAIYLTEFARAEDRRRHPAVRSTC